MMNERGIKALTSGIILQAVKDWYLCEGSITNGKRYVRDTYTHQVWDARPVQETIEGFFRSGWFVLLSDLDGPEMLETMQDGPVYRFFGTKISKVKTPKERKPSWNKLKDHPVLRKVLIANQINQQRLSDEMGISESTLDRWMNIGLTDGQLEMMREAAERIITRQ